VKIARTSAGPPSLTIRTRPAFCSV
jgi:hypothetical protein